MRKTISPNEVILNHITFVRYFYKDFERSVLPLAKDGIASRKLLGDLNEIQLSNYVILFQIYLAQLNLMSAHERKACKRLKTGRLKPRKNRCSIHLQTSLMKNTNMLKAGRKNCFINCQANRQLITHCRLGLWLGFFICKRQRT